MVRKNGWRHDFRRNIDEAEETAEAEGGPAILNRWYREEPIPVEVLLLYTPEADSPNDFRVRVNGDESVPELEAPTRGAARSQAFDYMENTPREAHADESEEAEADVDLSELPGSAEPAELDDASEDSVDGEAADVDPDEVSRCIAETSSGERCKNEAVEGSLYCSVPSHGPDDEETDESAAA